MIKLDFLEQMVMNVNANMQLKEQLTIGILKNGNAISCFTTPGGEETVFMDGSRIKALQIQFNARDNEYNNPLETLNEIFYYLENITDITSANNSYQFHEIVVTSLPSVVAFDEKGFATYQCSIAANIIIKKGVV